MDQFAAVAQLYALDDLAGLVPGVERCAVGEVPPDKGGLGPDASPPEDGLVEAFDRTGLAVGAGRAGLEEPRRPCYSAMNGGIGKSTETTMERKDRIRQ